MIWHGIKTKVSLEVPSFMMLERISTKQSVHMGRLKTKKPDMEVQRSF